MTILWPEVGDLVMVGYSRGALAWGKVEDVGERGILLDCRVMNGVTYTKGSPQRVVLLPWGAIDYCQACDKEDVEG